MPTTTTPARDSAAIRECIDASAQAIRTRNIDALMALYAPDVLVFDLMPLQTQGVEAYRKNFEAWFGSGTGDCGSPEDERPVDDHPRARVGAVQQQGDHAGRAFVRGLTG